MTKQRTTERGLLMLGPMALAAYRGIKTQTRRPVKNQTEHGPSLDMCPFGRVGDRIYVMETFLLNRNVGPEEYAKITYLADGAEHDTDGHSVCPIPNRINSSLERQRWTPSIHMPKWAARTWGTITGVLVERVQSISEEDAKAEGVESWVTPEGCLTPEQVVPGPGFNGSRLGDEPHRLPFAFLWEKLYGEDSWDTNPWVWVVKWERDKL